MRFQFLSLCNISEDHLSCTGSNHCTSVNFLQLRRKIAQLKKESENFDLFLEKEKVKVLISFCIAPWQSDPAIPTGCETLCQLPWRLVLTQLLHVGSVAPELDD